MGSHWWSSRAQADSADHAGIGSYSGDGTAHLRFISAMAPEIRGKSLLFGQWLEPQDIPDPYRKSVKHSTMFSDCWAKPVRNGLID
jgi:hypothetical protein